MALISYSESQIKGAMWALILFVLLILLIRTNPSKRSYVTYAKEQVLKQVGSNSVIASLISVLGQPLIKSATTVDDYAVCSIFTTKMLGNEVRTIGILKTFIPISRSELTN